MGSAGTRQGSEGLLPGVDGDGALSEELIGHLCCIQGHGSQCAQTWAQNHGITEWFGKDL